MTVDRTSPVKFLHSWNSFIYDISTNMIQIDLNDLIGFYHKSIQSFHDRFVVTFLTIRRFLILWAHLISYLCSILIWSNSACCSSADTYSRQVGGTKFLFISHVPILVCIRIVPIARTCTYQETETSHDACERCIPARMCRSHHNLETKKCGGNEKKRKSMSFDCCRIRTYARISHCISSATP